MPRSPDDDRWVARAAQSGASNTRVLVLAGGFALAVAATLAVFLTDNPQYLRIAVVAVAWAFVIATFAAGRRTGDRAEAEMRESELRHAYELELEREVSARREYELAVENEVRRETEDSMRDELDALRRDIAQLTGLRDEVARVSALGGDIAALTDLRDQVARVAAMQDDVRARSARSATTSPRWARCAGTSPHWARCGTTSPAWPPSATELGQLADLRADMGRLRAELTEQLSSEMLVERIVMRTQASRLSGEPGRLESGARSRARRAVELGRGRATAGADRRMAGHPAGRAAGDAAVRAGPHGPHPAPARRCRRRCPSRRPRGSRRPGSGASRRPRRGTPLGAAVLGDRRPGSRRAPEPEPWEAPRTGWTSAPLPPLAPPAGPATEFFPAAPLPPGAVSPLPSAPSADRWSPSVEPDLSPRRSRHSVDEPATAAAPPTAAFPMASPPVPSEPAPVADGLAGLPLAAGRADPAEPSPTPSPRRRRHDEPTAVPVPNEYAPTTQRPAVNGRPSPAPRPTPAPARPRAASPPSTVARPEFDRTAFRFAVREDAPAPAPPTPTSRGSSPRTATRNGSAPATGSRRQRRYRDDDESDDVLARVLRGD